MADKLSSQQRHYCMANIGSRNTKPELKVRHQLFSDGFRYRLNVRSLPGTPDITLPKYRTCIFVNGCFWHGHKGCKGYTVPETNTKFWIEKVHRNQERDLEVNSRLESLNWNVITVWECELKPMGFAKTMSRVEAELQANKTRWETYLLRRKEDRAFAMSERRRINEIRAIVEEKLQEQFHVPVTIRRMSHEYSD